MPPANLPACFTPENIATYRDQVLQSLSEIQAARHNNPTAYPESVCAILAAVTTPRTLDDKGRPLPPDCQPNPVALWVTDRCKQHADSADHAWRICVRKSKIELSKLSSKTQGLMAQERSWRFWSQFALTTAEIFSEKAFLNIPQTTADALKEFIAGATMIRNAIDTLVDDPRILRALPAQELPMLQQLEASLPGLIETFKTTDVKDWYPYKNLRGDATDRAWVRDVAEMAIRNLGHCDAGLLSKLISATDLPKSEFQNKWYGEQAKEAAKQIETYEARRYELDVRLPLVVQADDPLRPPHGLSAWLGKGPLL